MTIQDKGTRIQEVATAAQTEFTFIFDIFADTDLNVYLTPVGQPSDPTGDLLPPSAYVITLNGPLPSDGKITLNTPAVAGDIITLERDTPLARSTDFAVGGPFRADEINKQLDKLTAQIQQVETLIESRGVIYEVTDDLSDADNILPQLLPDTIWYKNGAGSIVAVDINGGDVNTLKAELASQTMAAPGSGIVGHYNTVVPGGTTVDAQLNLVTAESATTKNDLAEYELKIASQVAGAFGSGIVGHFNEVTQVGTNVQFQLNDNTQLLTNIGHVKPGVLNGLTLSKNVTLPLRDIDIAAGTAANSLNNNYLTSTTAFVKKLDVAWAEGTGVGGLFVGAITANTTYHVYMIEKVVGAVITIDFGFEPAFPPVSLPAGYVKYARIGNLRTDAGSNIRPFIQNGNYFLWEVIPLISEASTVSATRTVLFDVPLTPGESLIGMYGAHVSMAAANVNININSLLQNASTGILLSIDNVSSAGTQGEVILNDLGQCRAVFEFTAGGGNTIIEFQIYGWIDKRGGDTF